MADKGPKIRIASKQGDVGYNSNWHKTPLTVLLNGRELSDCVMADESAGVVTVEMTDEVFQYLYDENDNCITQQLSGDVQIEGLAPDFRKFHFELLKSRLWYYAF